MRILCNICWKARFSRRQGSLGSANKEIGEFTTRTEGVADFANVPCGSWTATVTKAGFEDGSLSIQTAGEPINEKSIALSPKIVRASTEVTDSTPHVEQSASENNEYCRPRRM